MNHKRKRSKQSRAGCLLCKPNKLGKGMEKKLGHRGFGKLRKEAGAEQELIDATYRWENDPRIFERIANARAGLRAARAIHLEDVKP